MRKLLIIYPLWPPSNLAGVHRARLVANFLPKFGWQPIILTVKEKYYEESLDPDIEKTVAPHIEVIKTEAYATLQLLGKRLIGDIGLRGFWQIYNNALKIVNNRNVDFIWIPIPSWYTALIGPLIYRKTGIPYGIDYIDPWVSQLAPYDRTFSRAWWSNRLARILEPIALKRASLISGVSTSYYQPALERNFKNKQRIRHVGMPYGFDPRDHQIELEDIEYPWPNDKSIDPYVYAGAFLPQSHIFIENLFQAIAEMKSQENWPQKAHFYFLGTGYYGGKTIEDYADEFGIGHIVTEIRDRFPFLHIQQYLRRAKGILIIGSTEKHYTASKTFQCLLADRPIWAIFHRESSATDILELCQADEYLVKYYDGVSTASFYEIILQKLKKYLLPQQDWNPDLYPLRKYSAEASAKALVRCIESALQK